MKKAAGVTFALGALAFIAIIGVTGGFIWEIYQSPHPPAQVPNETLTVILTAASLMILVVSLIVAGVAIGGTQVVREWIKDTAEEETQGLRDSIKASLRHGVGVVFAEMSFGGEHAEDPYEVTREDLLHSAITQTQEALNLWPDDAPERWRSRNNLCFLYALAFQNFGYHGDKSEKVAEWARKLKSRHAEQGVPEWMKTYMRVAAAFPREFSEQEISEAIDDGRSLKKTVEKQRHIEAIEHHLESLERVLEMKQEEESSGEIT